MNNNRVEWIDYAKAIAAMLVICLHIPNYQICRDLINSFVIPIFFILSGMTFSVKDENFVQYLKKKIRTLVWPSFILCGVLNIVIEFIYSIVVGIEYKVDIKQKLIGTVLQMRGSYEFGAWFLICLFTSQIIIYFLMKYLIKNNNQILIWALIFFLSGNVYALFIHKVLPWSLDVAIIAVSYILFGYYIKVTKLVKKVLENKYILIYSLMLIVGNIFSILRNDTINIYLNHLGNPISHMLTVVGGLGLTAIICSKIKSCEILSFIGKSSLMVYCLQYFVIYILDNALNISILPVNIIIYFITTLLVTLMMAYVIDRFVPFLVGK